MKRIIISAIIICFSQILYAQIFKTINVTAGNLKTALTITELSNVTKLTLSGTIDARDFKTMRDNMPLLAVLDLNGATIVNYTGTEGTDGSASITYPANKIPVKAFYNPDTSKGKSSLTSIVLPSTITSIGYHAFINCTGLTAIVLPSSVSSIDVCAFQGCSGLSSINIPWSVEFIGTGTFLGCSSLSSVTVNRDRPLDFSSSFDVFRDIKTPATLNVPYGSKEYYAAANQWKNFTNIVEMTAGFKLSEKKVSVLATQGSNVSVDISSNVTWSASIDQNWIKVSTTSGTGNQTLVFTAEANHSITERIAIITISASGVSSQTIVITQQVLPDRYEPDDSWQQAKPIFPFFEQDDRRIVGGEVDFVKFTITDAPRTIFVDLVPLTGLIKVWLYDTDGISELKYSDIGTKGHVTNLQQTFSKNGTYFLKIAVSDYQTDKSKSRYSILLTTDGKVPIVKCNKNDSLALVAVYNETNGDNWTNKKGWKTDRVQNWKGVTIDETGRVINLNLTRNNLQGKIPSEIGELTGLKFLYLGNEHFQNVDDKAKNSFQGSTIPNTMCNLINLEVLSIDNLKFGAELPDIFAGKFKLRELYIDNNNFTNSQFPKGILECVNLEHLEIQYNYISQLPALNGLKLSRFDAYNNKLTFDDIEPNIGISGFSYFSQYNIGVAQSISPAFGTTYSQTIEIGGENNHYQWYKDNSPLEGQISNTLKIINVSVKDAGIYHLEVSNSMVTDLKLYSEPITLCQKEMPLYKALESFYNSTGGNKWINNTNWLSDAPLTTWHGIIFDSSGTYGLSLRNNNLTGQLPANIGDLTIFNYIYLPQNQLSGSIPESIGNLSHLSYLSLYVNGLTGEIPVSIGNLSQLSFLELYMNGLSGEIPKTIGNLSKLSYVALFDNALTGSVPSSITSCTHLTWFEIRNNLIENLPDVSALPDLFIKTQNNRLQFDDLEPILNDKDWWGGNYTPQAKIGKTETITAPVNQPYTLSVFCGGQNNRYQWFKNGISITGEQSTAELDVNPVVYGNNGEFICKVTNSIVDSLMIESYPITIIGANTLNANAGPDKGVDEGTLVTLDGSKSYNPGGTPLSYVWTAPEGITLSSKTSAQPTFTAPEVTENTNFTLSLAVTDGTINSSADQVVITVKNRTIVAETGRSQTVDEGSLVTLGVSTSSNSNSENLTYHWSSPPEILLSSSNSANPTFIAPEVITDTDFIISLIVSDGVTNSTLKQVVIKVLNKNKAPVSNAGKDQTVEGGSTVTLDATGSFDPDSRMWIVTWTAPVTIILSSTTAFTPTFIAPNVTSETKYTFNLIVYDGSLNSTTDQVVVTVIPRTNKYPISNAGIDQSVNQGTIVTLDGSASLDPDFNPLTYKWTAPAGISLSSTNVAKPTFTAPVVNSDADYTFSLVVNDGTVDSPADQVVVTVKKVNNAPLANAGFDQFVNEGTIVSLDGTTSSDPDGNSLSYKWEVENEIKATVYNEGTTQVLISPEAFIKYSPNGLETKIVKAREGTKVFLTMSASDDKNHMLTFSSQSLSFLSSSFSKSGGSQSLTFPAPGVGTYEFVVDGTEKGNLIIESSLLSSYTVSKPTFIAPEVKKDSTFIISLVVNDGTLDSPVDQVTITIKNVNKTPVAKAGTVQSVNEGSIVSLDGSASSDPDGSMISYKWTAPPAIILSSTTVAKPTFKAPEVTANTNYTFSLVVNDGTVDSPVDQVVIVVINVNKVPVANAGTDQSVSEGLSITLDGTGSLDPNKDILTYKWSTGINIETPLTPEELAKVPFSPEAFIKYSANGLETKLIKAKEGTKVWLTISASDNKTHTLTFTDKVLESILVMFNGSQGGSSFNFLAPSAGSYEFTVDKTEKGMLIIESSLLNSSTLAKPIFTAPEVKRDTTFIFSLVVNNGMLDSQPDQVAITVKNVNKAPVANAGVDQSVNEGATVSLDGTASSDPDGNPLTYKWTAPTGITLSSTTVAKPTFTATEVTANTNYTFSLVVNDGMVDSPVDQVVITVKNVNKPPVANAGPDQSVNEGSTVSLDGSASSDPDGNPLTYKWTAPEGITLNSTTDAKPTFTAPEVTTNTNYTFSLVVNDGTIDSPADQVVITVKNINKAPVANAGTDQSINEGATVSLDGSASSDLDGNLLTYRWTAPAGITLSSTTIAKPTFTAPEVTTNANYTFSLVVNDGAVDSPVDQIVITVKNVNKAPVANAGVDQSVNEGATVSLDGSVSSDPDGNPLTYKWTAPTGITLNSTTVAKPTFIAPEVTTNTNYTISLVVNDGTVDSPVDQVVITIKNVNKTPVANAGVDQSVNEGATVSLDGSVSSDPDGNPLTYKWTAPTGISLSSTTFAKPTFIAPEVTSNTNYTFSLVVNDGTVDSPVDQVVITIKNVNKTPVANAGVDQSVNEGSIISLDGSASSDPDGNLLTYKWTAPTGITLSSTTFAKPTFIAPEVTTNTNYTFSLVVNDGMVDSPFDQVVITVKNINKAPVANAGVDQSVNEGATVSLDGSASSDPDGNPITYNWSAPIGIILSSTTVAKPIFTALEVKKDSTLNFSLVVNDGLVSSSPATVKVTVLNVIKVGITTIESPLLKIYPNPTKGIIQVEFGDIPQSGTWIRVYDISGKTVCKIAAKNKIETLNLNNHPAGLYLVRIDQKLPKTYKIVLEKTESVH